MAPSLSFLEGFLNYRPPFRIRLNANLAQGLKLFWPMGRGVNFLLILAVLSICNLSWGSGGVLSYRDWKAKRVAEARAVFGGLESEVRNTNHDERTRVEERRMEQAKLNVRIAQDLNPNDYFVLYLRDRVRGNPQAMNQAIKKMSPAEISEILRAYESFLDLRNAPGRTSPFGPLGLYRPLSKPMRSARAATVERFGLN